MLSLVFALRSEKRLENVELLHTDNLPLLVILKQSFFKFTNNAMNRFSPIINCVANIAIRNCEYY